MRKKIHFHRNYPEQKEGLQHEIGHLHLWMLWIRYKIFHTVLLIPAHINMYRNKQILSEKQRMERNAVVVTYRKGVSSVLLAVFLSVVLVFPLVSSLHIYFTNTLFVIDTSWNIIRSTKFTYTTHTTMMGHMVNL